VRKTRAETLLWSSALIGGISDLESVGARVMDEYGRDAGAHRLRDFGENRGSRVFQRHRAPENLADRVKEIDLLVSLRELGGGVLYLERGLGELRHDRHQQLDVALFR